MNSWSSPQDRRPPRKYYGSVASSASAGRAKRKRETECFTWLAVSGCLFLVVSLAALIFFLSQSDLELSPAASDSSEPCWANCGSARWTPTATRAARRCAEI